MTTLQTKNLGVFLISIVLAGGILAMGSGCTSSRTGSSTRTSAESSTSNDTSASKTQGSNESQENAMRLGLDEIEYPVVSDFFKAYNDVSESSVEYVEESERVSDTNVIVTVESQTEKPNDKAYVGTSHKGTKITAVSFQEDEGRLSIRIEPNEGKDPYTVDMYHTFIDALIAIDPDTTADEASAIWQQVEEKRGNDRLTKFLGSTSNASFTFADTGMTVRQDGGQYHPLAVEQNSTGSNDSSNEYDIGECYISIRNVPDPARIGRITSFNEVPFNGVIYDQE